MKPITPAELGPEAGDQGVPHSPAPSGSSSCCEVSASDPPPLSSSGIVDQPTAIAPRPRSAQESPSPQLDAAETALREACLLLTDRTDADANAEIERAVTQIMGLARLIQSQPPVDRAAFATVSKATC